MSRKPILCLDFDGVIHSYSSGWKGADIIPDLPVPGALEFLVLALSKFDVQIYSSRSNKPGGIDAMQGWLSAYMNILYEHVSLQEIEKQILSRIGWPTEKPPALVTIDDRALTFTGEWPSLETLVNFKPWNK